jgi:hypothetical protein
MEHEFDCLRIESMNHGKPMIIGASAEGLVACPSVAAAWDLSIRERTDSRLAGERADLVSKTRLSKIRPDKSC